MYETPRLLPKCRIQESIQNAVTHKNVSIQQISFDYYFIMLCELRWQTDLLFVWEILYANFVNTIAAVICLMQLISYIKRIGF